MKGLSFSSISFSFLEFSSSKIEGSIAFEKDEAEEART